MADGGNAVKYAARCVLSLDQLLNTVLGGYPDETLSSRCYRRGVLDENPARRWVFMCKWVNRLFFWQKNHCKTAYEREMAGLHTAKAFRKGESDDP